MGIVLVTGQRSEKSPLGTSRQLILQELEMLHPTISLPVAIALFDLGKPGECPEETVKVAATDEVKPMDEEPAQIQETISVPVKDTEGINGDHHESTENQQDILPPMPSTRRKTRYRRQRVAVNQ